MSFTRPVKIRFDEGDPRGILFYGRLQELSHRVFEEFVLAELVARWEDWFLTEEFVVPIRHAESTFNRPLRPGHEYEAELAVSKLGESSFEVLTRFYEPGDRAQACAETRVLHVFADPVRFRKIPIPSGLRARLEAHLARE
jgi:acyl-CoA thioester hydrolase/1,4-dihydroxy-2-naphthoyl-CoA hydrolase